MPADVAELVDAHGSGPCARKGVEVQVLSSAYRAGFCHDGTDDDRNRQPPDGYGDPGWFVGWNRPSDAGSIERRFRASVPRICATPGPWHTTGAGSGSEGHHHTVASYLAARPPGVASSRGPSSPCRRESPPVKQLEAAAHACGAPARPWQRWSRRASAAPRSRRRAGSQLPDEPEDPQDDSPATI